MNKSNDKRYVELETRVEELTAAIQRERADNMNLHRLHKEQISSLKEVIKAELVSELLPVIDNFERSLSHIPKDLTDNSYIKGVQSIVKQFEATLGRLGVTRILTVNQPFNPRLHEAVSVEAGDGEYEIIGEELQPGYQLGDHIIRPAMVKVTKAHKLNQ